MCPARPSNQSVLCRKYLISVGPLLCDAFKSPKWSDPTCVAVPKSVLISFSVFFSPPSPFLLKKIVYLSFLWIFRTKPSSEKKEKHAVKSIQDTWSHRLLVWINQGVWLPCTLHLWHSKLFWIKVSTKWFSGFPSRLHHQWEYGCLKQNEMQRPLSILKSAATFLHIRELFTGWGVEG